MIGNGRNGKNCSATVWAVDDYQRHLQYMQWCKIAGIYELEPKKWSFDMYAARLYKAEAIACFQSEHV